MIAEAMALLDWAHEQNPGPWRAHSLGVARACGEIARGLGLDHEKAYALGLLHDIGRYEGVRGMHHVIAGYELLMSRGMEEAARISITHSFPDRKLEHYIGKKDVTPEEEAEIRRILARADFDDYDRLVQLGDAIAWGEGVCLMEKRLVDVVLRHGFQEGMKEKWQAWFDLKADFEQRMGKSIYSLFPEVYENTFG